MGYTGGMNILITGAAGYIGGLLADQYRQREEVEWVVCLDQEACPTWLEGQEKIVWVRADLSREEWEREVRPYAPRLVIHAAWQLRDGYGEREATREKNIQSARRVFRYVFETSSVHSLIYFSSIAPYGARRTNSREERFTEDSPLRLSGYGYADDKYEVEKLIREMYQEVGTGTSVTVLKPSTVTGPRGRGVGKFSLVAALTPDANKTAIPFYVRWALSCMPIVGRWTRQFVHEDDLTDVVTLLAFTEQAPTLRTYILSPFDVIDGKDMARLTGKLALHIPVPLARLVFSLAWRGSRGRVPTAPGVWRFFAYPICVDGSRLEEDLGYRYRYTSRQAIGELRGRYARN